MKQLHLLTSALIIIAVAIVYGSIPDGFFKSLFRFTMQQTDMPGILRAMMGLYMAMAIFWIIGISKATYWKAATLSNILFMAGLACGRTISIILDGMPSAIFLAGLAGEILLATWGAFNLYKYKNNG